VHEMRKTNYIHIFAYLLFAIGGAIYYHHIEIRPLPYLLASYEFLGLVAAAASLGEKNGYLCFIMVIIAGFRCVASFWPDKGEANSFRFAAVVMAMHMCVSYLPGLREFYEWLNSGAGVEGSIGHMEGTLLFAFDMVLAWMLIMILQLKVYPEVLGIQDTKFAKQVGTILLANGV